KAILAAFSRDETMLAMFRKEATILSRLQHDAIVRYYHFTVDRQSGVPYLVMEFVDGVPLNDRLTRAPRDPATARRLILRLASGLAAAHRAGVVHRDLSPDNIILPDDDVDHAKIIDFGIARAGTIGGATVVGEKWAGKYNYMSPEQLGLYGGDVTARSDIYSLGLLAAAAVLSRPLDMAGTLTEIIEKRRTVPDLSEVDAQLRPAIARMLEPKPEDRPADIDAVIALLAEPGLQAQSERTVIVQAPPQQTRSDDPWAATTTPPQHSIRPAPPPRPISASGATRVGTPPMPIEEDSPFGPPVDAPITPARPTAERPPAATAPPKRGPSAMIAAGIVAVLIVGGGALAFQQGLLTPLLGGSPPSPSVPEQPDITPPAEPAVAETPIQLELPIAVQPASPPPEPAIAVAAVTEPPPELVATPEPSVTPPVAQTPTPNVEPVIDTPPAPVVVAAVPDAVVTPPPATTSTTIGVALDDVGWLLAYKLGACQYANVTSVAENAVTIDALSTDLAPMQTLMTDFQAARGYEPDIKLGLTATPQCPAVDFLHAAEAIGATGPEMTLSRYNIASGEPFEGFIENAANWQLQLLIVDAAGAVSPVPVTVSTSGSAAKFDLTLTSDQAEAEPMLFILLASKTGLDAARFTGSKPGSTLFPQLLDAVRGAPAPVAITSAYFKLGG
ncbi:MAG TPA: protein kinase, partial [Devosia sp.]|nr:protein kinase [Devosia sp.]